jgi:hypothetical protein
MKEQLQFSKVTIFPLFTRSGDTALRDDAACCRKREPFQDEPIAGIP